MAKMLKAPEKTRVLSDDEVVKIVKENSSRYLVLQRYQSLDDKTFFSAYLQFTEGILPQGNPAFVDKRYPQITSNMFYIVESRECKNLITELNLRFENLRKTHTVYKNARDKEYFGKALTKESRNQI